MGKKNRKNKKEIVYKSSEERESDIQEIKDKLNILGLTEDLARITDIFEIMDCFIETGKSVSVGIPSRIPAKKIDQTRQNQFEPASDTNM